jgi:hypothetical protein
MVWVRWRHVGQWILVLGILGGSGCRLAREEPPPRTFNVYQNWALGPGDNLAGYRVHSGLGDVAIDLEGGRLYMPFNGQVQRAAGYGDRCLVVSSPDVPAYLFRLCGVTQQRTGHHRTGEVIGRGFIVAFATMRRQADGTWAMVEPAQDFIAQFLHEP